MRQQMEPKILRCQAVKCGFRGGDWNNGSTNERVSDRNNAANVDATRNNERGARFAKTTFFMVGWLDKVKFVKLADAAGISVATGTGRGIIEKGMSKSDSSPRILREKTQYHSVDASAGWSRRHKVSGCKVRFTRRRLERWVNQRTCLRP